MKKRISQLMDCLKGKKKLFIGILVGILVISMIGTAVLSITTALNVNKLSGDIRSYMGISEDVTQENDVVIGGQYTIKDTTAISDAYKDDSTSGLDDKQKETLDMAKKVLKEVIKKGMTDYEKELAVYEWMLANLKSDTGAFSVIPDTSDDCDNPYGVLKYHNAVCVGYATTFRMFMQMLDIECMVVHETSLSHSWDLVKIGGDWYHVDVYYAIDDGGYQYFNMNDEIAKEMRDWNTDFFPAATSLKYNYANKNRAEVKDTFEMAQVVADKVSNQEKAFAIAYDHKVSQSEATLGDAMISNISSCITSGALGMDISMSWSWEQDQEKGYVVFVYVTYPAQSGENDQIDEQDQRKIEKAIKKAFGTDWYFQGAGSDYMDGAMG